MVSSLRQDLPLLTRRPSFAVLLAGLVALGGAMAITAWYGVPRPLYQDEQSYLLAADTFARGRIANPPHAFWRHFETFHVIQQPTYVSKFPPAQGVVLALGTALGGHPIAGVWLGTFAMGMALCWMLQGWVPPRWALAGALLAVFQTGLFTYWSQGYWGGAVAATGGALVFGALPRILAHGRTRDALWMAFGLSLLANCRPFEGAVVSLAAAVPLARWVFDDFQPRVRRVALPISAVLLFTGGAMMAYNEALTGDPLKMPYMVYEETYNQAPVFLWQEARPLNYRHEIMERHYTKWRGSFLEQRSVDGWFSFFIRRLRLTWNTFFGPVLVLPWLLLPWTLHRPGVRIAVAAFGIYLLPASFIAGHLPHYAAPLLGLGYLVVVEALRQAWAWAGERRRSAFGLLVLGAFLCVGERLTRTDSILRVGSARSINEPKANVEGKLADLGGRHLVFVHYGPDADNHDDWVANGAEIDAADIVWARPLSEREDQALMDYFKNRQAWRIHIGFTGRGSIQVERVPALN